MDIRKIEAGKLDLKLKKLAPGPVVDRAVGSISSLASDAGVEIEIDIQKDEHLLADEDKLQQVMSNLLSNAIKWSPVDGNVTIKVLEGKKGRLRFEIHDQGPGVPSEEAEKLFGRFEQVSNRDNRDKGGTGLGLAIAKAIVEQHGGAIGIISGEDTEGSIFWFEIPPFVADSPKVTL